MLRTSMQRDASPSGHGFCEIEDRDCAARLPARGAGGGLPDDGEKNCFQELWA
jgi:hypothetical protein